ncbi:MAG: nuclear transport factor 2 family protein [Massilia sp.]
MNEQTNIDLVRQCYDDFLRGDIPQVLSHFAQDIDWELTAVESIPFTGKRRGLDQVAGFFREMNELQEFRDFRPLEFIAQGDRVVVLGHYRVAVKATGAEFDSDWTHVFTIDGGKFVKFREFSDTHKAALAYQPPAGAIGSAARAGGDRPAAH